MPDDYHPPTPRRNPEDIDLAAIKADLEFLIERVERFRRDQALKPLYTMVGSAARREVDDAPANVWAAVVDLTMTERRLSRFVTFA
jgi:hypothetical protein